MQIPRKYSLVIVFLMISGVILAWGALSLNVNNTATVVIEQKNFAAEIIPVWYRLSSLWCVRLQRVEQ